MSAGQMASSLGSMAGATPWGIGLDVVGGLASLFGGNSAARRQRQLYNQALDVLGKAQNYNPETNPEFRTAQDVGDMNTSRYMTEMKNRALDQYGHQGLMGSSMVLSTLVPQAAASFHAVSGQNKLGQAQLGNELTNSNWQRALGYANALTGQGSEYGNAMDQYYQNAMSGLTHAGDLLGEGDQTSRLAGVQSNLQKLYQQIANRTANSGTSNTSVPPTVGMFPWASTGQLPPGLSQVAAGQSYGAPSLWGKNATLSPAAGGG
jgi:hypothetical protein